MTLLAQLELLCERYETSDVTVQVFIRRVCFTDDPRCMNTSLISSVSRKNNVIEKTFYFYAAAVIRRI